MRASGARLGEAEGGVYSAQVFRPAFDALSFAALGHVVEFLLYLRLYVAFDILTASGPFEPASLCSQRCPLRAPADAAQPGIHGRGGAFTGTRNRREHRNLQPVLHHRAAPAAGRTSRAARGVGKRLAERAPLGRLLGMGEI